MEQLRFVVPGEYDGKKTLVFLRNFCGASTNQINKLKRVDGGITRGGATLRTIDPVAAGDEILLRLPPDLCLVEPCEVPFEVMYEDAHFILLNKPAGLLTHPHAGPPEPSLAGGVTRYLAGKDEPAAFRPLGRLDRNTSGLVVAAKHAFAAFALHGKINKRYYGICEGALTREGVIDLPLRPKTDSKIEQMAASDGKPAVTRYRILGVGGGHTLFEAELLTGRTHQIRAHFAAMGYPLAGDDLYGGSTEHITRQALHCGHVWFVHPFGGEMVDVRADFPADFSGLVEKFGL